MGAGALWAKRGGSTGGLVTRGVEGVLRARAACPCAALHKPPSAVPRSSSIGRLPSAEGDRFSSERAFWSPRLALDQSFPPLLAEHHGYPQGEADDARCCRSRGPQQQDHCCGGWTGWDGLCYQHPWKGTAQGQCAAWVLRCLFVLANGGKFGRLVQE